MKKLISIAMALLILTLVVSVRGESAPRAEIVGFECPSQVSAGESFNVNVSIRYSYEGWTLADLGIFQGDFTNVLDYIRYYLTGEGLRNFTLTVPALDTSTSLHLRLVTRYWYQNFWLSDARGSADFYVSVVGSSETPTEQAFIVRIGENEWYYWNNSASDACLVWLSGGHAFSDHVTMNPYEMETFGAMKYINDLSKRFSVLALHKGTEGHTIAFTSQPFYALGYYPDSTCLKRLHDWSLEQGYNFTYLVGYSTGGTAAGYEIAIRDPETWAAPDGSVMISAQLEGLTPNNLLESISHANSVKADVELLYGGIWSEKLWPQGKEFYDNAPEKTNVPWYLKEWRFFPDSSHEVWVKEQDGAHYNSVAYELTAQFIEKCKSPWRKLSEWNDGGIEVHDVTVDDYTGEQKPKTPGSSFTTKVGNTLKVKVWLYNCSTFDTYMRATISYIKIDLYSSEGYVDTRYTNVDGYEEFVFTVPKSWENKSVKIFTTLGGEYRGIYTPTVNLFVNPQST